MSVFCKCCCRSQSRFGALCTCGCTRWILTYAHTYCELMSGSQRDVYVWNEQKRIKPSVWAILSTKSYLSCRKKDSSDVFPWVTTHSIHSRLTGDENSEDTKRSGILMIIQHHTIGFNTIACLCWKLSTVCVCARVMLVLQRRLVLHEGENWYCTEIKGKW